jgi:hypothetical protein
MTDKGDVHDGTGCVYETWGLFIQKVMTVRNYGLGSPFDTLIAILVQTAV